MTHARFLALTDTDLGEGARKILPGPTLSFFHFGPAEGGKWGITHVSKFLYQQRVNATNYTQKSYLTLNWLLDKSLHH